MNYKSGFGLALMLLVGGCASASHAERGAAIGTGIGAATGAIIGHQSGNEGLGTVIGAASGAMVGGLVGENQDLKEERDTAVAHAQYLQNRAITNQDVINMTRSGVGDAIIINSINTRGGSFNTSPESLIMLKNQGVSEQVMQAMITAGPPNTVSVVETSPTVVVPRTKVVIAPRRRVIFGRRHRHHHHWYH